MINFFLSRDIVAAKQSLQAWKWLYSREEYPHAIVRAMLQDSYTMQLLWDDFKNDSIPMSNQAMAVFQMESLYAEKLTTTVEPHLEEWLDGRRSELVGGISYAFYDGLAKVAETDDSLLEEVEFSFVFHHLLNKAVLYTIAFCSAGDEIKESLGRLTGKTLKDTDDLSYDQTKYFFQEISVKDYVRLHLPEGMQDNSFAFLGDKYSHATSNLAIYIYKTPGLCNYLQTCSELTSLDCLMDMYADHLQQQSCLTSIIRTRITNIKKQYVNIHANIEKLLQTNEDQRLMDDFDVSEYHRRAANGDDVVEYFSTCTHPYVCARIANDLLAQSSTSAIGLVYLQKALNGAFGFPNIFWNNSEALCGCVDALHLLTNLLPIHAVDEFEQIFGVSLFKLQYVLLRRVVAMCKGKQQEQYYAKFLAALISQHQEQLAGEGLGIQAIEWRASYFNADNLFTPAEYQLAEILFAQFENNSYNLYSIGNLRVGEDNIADLIQYLKQEQRSTLSLFLHDRYYSAFSVADVFSSSLNSWSRPFTTSEKHKIDIATLKNDVARFEMFLDEQGVECFYHFTDRANLESIRKNGLLSCRYLKQNQIPTYSGGDAEMQRLDKAYELDDHIRLSFCKRHPMGWRLKMRENRDFVVLMVDRRVAFSKDTLFSNINATNPNHHHGGELSDLQAVNWEAVNAVYSAMDSLQHEQMTAEVMVKKNIPIEYILNIDNPESF